MSDRPATGRRHGRDATVREKGSGVPEFHVRRLAEVDSTNRYARDAARAGAAPGLVVVADHQSAGRGRLGRAWSAPPGSSLLVSVLLRPALPVERLHLVTAGAALAMADSIRDVAGFWPALKWPNDLLADGRKLAGLLAEVDLGLGGVVRSVVIGVGVNVQWREVPSDLGAPATACNLVAGRPVSRDDLLDAFLTRFAERLDAPPNALLADYRSRLATLGTRVRVEQARGTIVGTALDVDDMGALLVEVSTGQVLAIAAGDVVHLRPAPASGGPTASPS